MSAPQFFLGITVVFFVTCLTHSAIATPEPATVDTTTIQASTPMTEATANITTNSPVTTESISVCKSTSCEPGFICVEKGGRETCVNETKPGQCPWYKCLPPKDPCSKNDCLTDLDCPRKKKCCRQCGNCHRCILPLKPVRLCGGKKCRASETCVAVASDCDDTTCDPLLYKCIRSKCSLAPKVGPCMAAMKRYYFNPHSRACQSFIYGGCGGNNNNFETLEQCQTECPYSLPRASTE